MGMRPAEYGRYCYSSFAWSKGVEEKEEREEEADDNEGVAFPIFDIFWIENMSRKVWQKSRSSIFEASASSKK